MVLIQLVATTVHAILAKMQLSAIVSLTSDEIALKAIFANLGSALKVHVLLVMALIAVIMALMLHVPLGIVVLVVIVCRFHSVENAKTQHSVLPIPLIFPVYMVHAVVQF